MRRFTAPLGLAAHTAYSSSMQQAYTTPLSLASRTQYRVARYKGPLGKQPNKRQVMSPAFGSTATQPSANKDAPNETVASVDVSSTALQAQLPDVVHSEKPAKKKKNKKQKAARNASNTEQMGKLVKVMDKFALSVEHTPFESLEDAFGGLPETMRDAFREYCKNQQIESLTPLQQAVMPLLMENRDMVMVGPTGSGKTVAFLVPLMTHLLGEGVAPGLSPTETKLQMLNNEILKRIREGKICRFCELDMSKVRVCPTTGKFHPMPKESRELTEEPGQEEGSHQRTSLKSTTSITEPKLLVLSPTNPLTIQNYKVGRAFHLGFKVGHLSRATSLEEKAAVMKSFEGCDVLFATPEQAVVALYKNRLSLKSLHAVVFDEMDELLSRQQFDPVKILMGAMNKGNARPQRVFVGATFPREIRELVTKSLLLPSHRFVLGLNAAGVSNSFTALPTSTNFSHTVLVVSHMEKIERLLGLFESKTIDPRQRTIIFAHSAATVAFIFDRIAHPLKEAYNIQTSVLYRDAERQARDSVKKRFEVGATHVLVTTDTCSRGIDFKGISNVIQFDMPPDIDTWVHRSGRCGRRGTEGNTYTFFQPEDIRLARPLVAILRDSHQPIPTKLQEYANATFVENLTKSNLHGATKTKRKANQEFHQQVVPAIGRYPDFKQDKQNKHFRPMS